MQLPKKRMGAIATEEVISRFVAAGQEVSDGKTISPELLYNMEVSEAGQLVPREVRRYYTGLGATICALFCHRDDIFLVAKNTTQYLLFTSANGWQQEVLGSVQAFARANIFALSWDAEQVFFFPFCRRYCYESGTVASMRFRIEGGMPYYVVAVSPTTQLTKSILAGVQCDPAQIETLQPGDHLLVSLYGNKTTARHSLPILKMDRDAGVLFFPDAQMEQFSDYLGEGTYFAVECETMVLDGAVAVNDRLWGYKNDRLYASAEHRPFCFCTDTRTDENDAFTQTVPREEPTAVTVCDGKPLFFSENGYTRIMGDTSDNFTALFYPAVGVAAEYAKTVVSFGDSVLYVARDAIYEYRSGQTVPLVSLPFARVERACAARDGQIYYLLCDTPEGDRLLISYCLLTKELSVLDGEGMISVLPMGERLLYITPSAIGLCHGDDLPASMMTKFTKHKGAPPTAMALFHEIKAPALPHSLVLDAQLDADSSIKVFLRADEGKFEQVGILTGESRGRHILPLRPMRTVCRQVAILCKGNFTVRGVGTTATHAPLGAGARVVGTPKTT